MSSVPSISAAESRNFWPLSSQVISGSSGWSAIGLSSLAFGQVNLANFFSHCTPGSCDHASGWSTGAPLALIWGCVACCDGTAAEGAGVAGAAGVGVGSAKGAGLGLGVAWLAFGVFEVALLEGLALDEGLDFEDGVGDADWLAAGVPGWGAPATSRNRSWAVRWTASTRLEAFLPGISTMMLRLPEVETSASETPLPLTRRSTMLAACFSLVGVTASPDSRADSVIRVPPSRSSPSRGFQDSPRAASP